MLQYILQHYGIPASPHKNSDLKSRGPKSDNLLSLSRRLRGFLSALSLKMPDVLLHTLNPKP